MKLPKIHSLFWLPLAVVLTMGWLAYLPGLAGGFLFDDWANLNALGAYGPVDNATTLWRYLTSGTADATGRPLALLSFLLDARDWPADPYPFKRTSLLLHLTNGVLLALLLARLGRASITPDSDIGDIGARTVYCHRVKLAAVLGGGLWLLHPLFVSTTLYIVQREAMLPATFILLGLYGYTVGREWARAGKRKGVALAAASILTCTVLATLCKANGVLLPILALVLDAVLLAPRQRMQHPQTAPAFRWMRRAVIVLPSLVVLTALVGIALHGFLEGVPEVRAWTLGERLLTQPRVVMDYLQLLWLPQPYSNGLFNDAVVISHGLLSPPSTLLSIVFLSSLVGAAVVLRRQAPIISASILFFFTAHLMESSVVPLELYFEHRNYIPALLMFWPLGWWLAGAWTREGGKADLIFVRKALCFSLPFLFALLAFLRADLWGNVEDQALLWAARNPDSPRAQAYAAQTETRRGEATLAIKRLEETLEKHPQEVQLAANLIDARCATGGTNTADLHLMAAALASDRTRSLAFGWLSRKLDALRDGISPCNGLELPKLTQLVDSLAANPGMNTAPGRVAEVLHLRGRIHLLSGEPNAALKSFDAALQLVPTPAKALGQAAILSEAGYPELGIQHLDKCSPSCGGLPSWGKGMPALHARLLESQNYWQKEIAYLREALAFEAAQGGA